MALSRAFAEVLVFGLLVLASGMASGQAYPTKPIRIVTAAAGGGSDFDARLIAQGLADPLGQPVIVDNRGGTLIIGEAVSKAPPDGYTLMLNGQSHWIIPLLQKAAYDPVQDFSPISLIEKSVWVVVVHPSLPVKSVKELIALAKAKPGALNYSTSAIGTGPHLSAELFNSMANTKIVHVPYKGAAAQNIAVMSGEVQMTITGATAVMPHVKSGKLRALAVTSVEPTALVPGLPTVAQTLPGYESVSMAAMFAPAKTPIAIINRLNQEIVRLLGRAEVKETLFKAGVDVVGSSPAALASTMKTDMDRMGKVIKALDIRAE